ncbi:MAG: hypothetical protein [Caudoviricetes sp.]|nr:MAG: hypothetical protein [Caudoviricetes sp.]
MSEFKVGDIVENVRDCEMGICTGNKYKVTSTLLDGRICFLDDDGDHRTRRGDFYKLHSRASETPPATITHEGYTYTRGERVCPEWLKGGAWVISRRTGILYKVTHAGNDRFCAANSDGSYNCGQISASEFIRAYRPHEPSDYKWGDWAMYEGKKVFVMNEIDVTRHIPISGVGIGITGANYKFVTANQLTPTHAP